MKIVLTFTLAVVSTHALDNGFTRPPMGWSALYGAPFQEVNETILKVAADNLQSSGLLTAGYEYVTIDDWWADRDVNGIIRGTPAKFPSGMKAIADHVHAKGCKFGVYSAASERTCGNFSASLFKEVQDAKTMADWGIDYLKYDSCRYSFGVASRARYQAMSRALNATGRKIFYSVEGWNPDDGGFWGPELANMWRTGSDIWPSWDLCILNNLYQTNRAARYNRYSMQAEGILKSHSGGGFNDGDMLQPPNSMMTVRKPGLTQEESMSQFKLWSIMKTPLILGINWQQLATVSKTNPNYFKLITNKEIIQVNQDESPQAVLVGQYPSAAQQVNETGLNVTLQECSLSRPDQRFASVKGGYIQLAKTNLCLSVGPDMLGDQGGILQSVLAKPCPIVNDTFSFVPNEQLDIVITSTKSCLTIEDDGLAVSKLKATKCVLESPINHITKTDPVPIDFQEKFNSQIFIWGAKTQQIVSAGNQLCLTVGNPNYDPHRTPQAGQNGGYTNAGTLEHEVWFGPLSKTITGKRRFVVGLFNKGRTTETLVAPSATIGTDQFAMTVRDIVSNADLPDLNIHQNLEVSVPSHGVALVILQES